VSVETSLRRDPNEEGGVNLGGERGGAANVDRQVPSNFRELLLDQSLLSLLSHPELVELCGRAARLERSSRTHLNRSPVTTAVVDNMSVDYETVTSIMGGHVRVTVCDRVTMTEDSPASPPVVSSKVGSVDMLEFNTEESTMDTGRLTRNSSTVTHESETRVLGSSRTVNESDTTLSDSIGIVHRAIDDSLLQNASDVTKINETSKITRNICVTEHLSIIGTPDSSVTERDSSVTVRDLSVTKRDPSHTLRDPNITSQDPNIRPREPSITTKDPSITTQDANIKSPAETGNTAVHDSMMRPPGDSSVPLTEGVTDSRAGEERDGGRTAGLNGEVGARLSQTLDSVLNHLHGVNELSHLSVSPQTSADFIAGAKGRKYSDEKLNGPSLGPPRVDAPDIEPATVVGTQGAVNDERQTKVVKGEGQQTTVENDEASAGLRVELSQMRHLNNVLLEQIELSSNGEFNPQLIVALVHEIERLKDQWSQLNGGRQQGTYLDGSAAEGHPQSSVQQETNLDVGAARGSRGYPQSSVHQGTNLDGSAAREYPQSSFQRELDNLGRSTRVDRKLTDGAEESRDWFTLGEQEQEHSVDSSSYRRSRQSEKQGDVYEQLKEAQLQLRIAQLSEELEQAQVIIGQHRKRAVATLLPVSDYSQGTPLEVTRAANLHAFVRLHGEVDQLRQQLKHRSRPGEGNNSKEQQLMDVTVGGDSTMQSVDWSVCVSRLSFDGLNRVTPNIRSLVEVSEQSVISVFVLISPT